MVAYCFHDMFISFQCYFVLLQSLSHVSELQESIHSLILQEIQTCGACSCTDSQPQKKNVYGRVFSLYW